MQAPGKAILNVQIRRLAIRGVSLSARSHCVDGELQLSVFFTAHRFREKEFFNVDR
jgi:hypothetical protein